MTQEELLKLAEVKNKDKGFKSLIIYKLYQICKEMDDIDLARTLLLLGSLLVEDPEHSKFLYNKSRSLSKTVKEAP